MLSVQLLVEKTKKLIKLINDFIFFLGGGSNDNKPKSLFYVKISTTQNRERERKIEGERYAERGRGRRVERKRERERVFLRKSYRGKINILLTQICARAKGCFVPGFFGCVLTRPMLRALNFFLVVHILP